MFLQVFETSVLDNTLSVVCLHVPNQVTTATYVKVR